MNVEPPLPQEALASIRAPFSALGAPLIDAPILLPLGPVLDLAGEVMRARLFIVQADGVEDAVLRPDFTIAVARSHIASGATAARYIYEGKAFRVAPKGSRRAEEFLQIGFEVFGGGRDASIDAEVASLAWRAAAAGGRQDLNMILGDIALFAALLDAMGLAPALAARLKRAFARGGTIGRELDRARAGAGAPRQGDRLAALLADLPETEAAAVLQDLWSIAGIQPVGGRSPGEIAHRLVQRGEAARGPTLTPAEAGLIGEYLALSGPVRRALEAVEALAKRGGLALDHELGCWSTRLDAILDGGAPEDRLHFQAAFGRSFTYYDGFLFEVRTPQLADDAPVAAGGRYDSLPGALGGEVLGAVGCAVRPGRAWAGAEGPG